MRKIIVSLGGLMLAACFVWFTMRWFHGKTVGEALYRLIQSPGLLLMMTAGYGLSFWLKALSWRLYVGHEREDPLSYYVHPLFVSLLVNHLLPVKAGDLARTGLLARQASMRWDDALHSVAAMRVLDMASLLLIGSLGAVALGLEASPWFLVMLVCGLFAAAFGWLAFERMRRKNRLQQSGAALVEQSGAAIAVEQSGTAMAEQSDARMLVDDATTLEQRNDTRVKRSYAPVLGQDAPMGKDGVCLARRGLLSFVLRHYEHLRGVLASGRGAASASLTLASWVLEGAVVYGVTCSLGLTVSPLEAIWVTGMTIAGQIFHISPGGIGTYETTLTASLGVLGVTGTTAYTAALLSHAYKFAFAYSAGVLSVLMSAITWKEMRGWLQLRKREGQGE